MRKLYSLVVLLLSFGTTVSVAQSAGDYQSHQSGPWNDVNSWEQFDGVSWVYPSPQTPSNDGFFTTILNLHTITVSADETINQVTINSGGTVIINSGITLTADEDFSNTPLHVAAGATVTVVGTLDAATNLIISPVNVDGTITSSGSVLSGDPSLMFFNSNSTYKHQNTSGGAIPLSTWDPASNCIINGMNATTPSPPSNLGQAFGNFTWNCPSQGLNAAFNFGGLLTNIQGTLTFQSSNARPIRFNNIGPGYTMTVGVDFINQAVPIILTTSSTSGNTAVTVARDVTLSGGSVTFKATNNFNVRLEVGRNFLKTAGAFAGGNGTGTATLAFNGAQIQSYGMSGTAPANINYEIINSSTVNASGINAFSGAGSFLLQAGSILGVGSVDVLGAIQLPNASVGNVTVTGTRTYESGSTIVYNGLSLQKIGNGHPTTSGVDITISNSNGVSIIAPTTLAGNINLTGGDLNIGTSSLTITGNITGTHKISIAAAGSLTVGGSSSIGTFPFTTGTQTFLNFTLNNTNGITFANDVTITGVVTLTNGQLTFNGQPLTLNGTLTAGAGSLSGNATSTLTIGGSGAFGTLATVPGNTLGTLTFNRSSGTANINSALTVASALNLSNGDFTNTNGLTVANNATLTRSSAGQLLGSAPTNLPAGQFYNVIYTGGSLTSGLELPNTSDDELGSLTINTGGAVTLAQNIIVHKDVNLQSSTLQFTGSNSITMVGNPGTWNKTGGSFSGGTGTVIFGGNTTVAAGSTANFTNITINSSSTVNLPANNINIGGNVINNGTISPSTGTVIFNGTTTISGTSATSFNNVTVGVAGTGTLIAPLNGSTTVSIAGNFVNNGTFTHNNGKTTFNGTSTISGTTTPTNLFSVTITGSLTAPSGVLGIAGDLTNTAGTFNSNSGTVFLNGTTSAQTVTGTFNLNAVNVSNPSGVINNGIINLSDALTLTSSAAIFDADGSGSGVLTVKSIDVNTGGRIATLPTPANFSGQVTMERFINGPDSYRYISLPLTTGNVGLWKANFPVTGNFSDPSPVGVNGVVNSTAPSIYFYNGVTQAYVTVGSGGTTASTSLSNLVGYSAYTYISSNFTISTRGNVRTGAIGIPISTSGFNLISNPYPSPIDWDNITLTGVSTTMSVRAANGVFASYVKGGAATNAPFVGWTGEVATGQSFWVTSSGASTLNVDESAKTGNQNKFLRILPPQNLVRVKLTSPTQSDETVVWFNEDATVGVDDNFDALKMRNGYFDPGERKKNAYLNISTFAMDSTEYAINGLPLLTCNGTLNLRVADVAPGDYAISLSLEAFNLGYQAILVDHFTAGEKIMSNGSSYNFSVSEDKSSFGSSRFELRFILPGSSWISSVNPPSTAITEACDPAMLPVTINSQSDVYYQLFAGGKAISDSVVGNNQKITVNVPKEKLAQGTNNLNIRVSSVTGCDSYQFNNVLAYDYEPIVPVNLSRDELTLKSNVSTGNQWLYNDDPINGATDQTYTAVETGYYRVKVAFGACSVLSDSLYLDVTRTIQVYPMPATDKVYIVLPVDVNETLQGISIIDIKGNKIFDSNNNPEILTSQVKVIDMSGRDAGLYLLEIMANKRYTLKIMKK